MIATLFRFEVEERKQPAAGRNASFQLQYSDGGRKVEAAGSGTSWVHHSDDHINYRQQWSVRMPVHDDLRIRKGSIQRVWCRASELIAMCHHDIEAVETQGGNLRKAPPKLGSIGVAIDRRHRGQ